MPVFKCLMCCNYCDLQVVVLKTAKNNANKKCSDLTKKLAEVQAELQLCSQRLQTSKLTTQVDWLNIHLYSWYIFKV